MEIVNLLDFSRREQLREWLSKSHSTSQEVWVTANRSKQPHPNAVPYVDVVEEALCFGWIDSTHKKLSDGRNAQRITPRRKGSHWTELNKQRYHELEERGLMTDVGLNVFPDN